jgi:hypothetical protein
MWIGEAFDGDAARLGIATTGMSPSFRAPVATRGPGSSSPKLCKWRGSMAAINRDLYQALAYYEVFAP